LKIKLAFISSISLFIIIVASCKKENNIINNNRALFILNKIEASKTNEKDKNKSLDSLYHELLFAHNDSINRNLLFKIGNIFYYDNNLKKYLEVNQKINFLATIDNDSVHIAKSLYYLGDYYDAKSQLDSAYYHYYKAEKTYNSLNDTINTGRLILNKAGILYDNGSFKESETELIKSLKLLLTQKNERLIYECYNILALDLLALKDYKKSLEYFNLTIKQLNKLEKLNSEGIEFSKATCINNIGNVYLKIENYNKAEEYFRKGLLVKNMRKTKPELFAMILNNLAYAKLKSNKIEGVKEMLFKSYNIRDSIKSDAGIISSKCKIGEYYLYKKDTTNAINNIYSYYTLSKKVKSSPDVLNSLKLLTEIDTKNKNFYANEYFRVNDSLQQAERATRNKFARIEFETDQVEEENSILIKKNTYIIIGAIVLLSIASAFFMLYRLKTKNKELKHIQDQQTKNEEIYQLLLKQQSISEESRKEERNRIAMELHDGVVNSVFTSRFNLMQLQSSETDKKDILIKELEKTETEIRRVSHELNTNLNFNDDSIINMITNLVEAQKNEWNTQFIVNIDKFIDWNKIAVEAKMNTYRIIQEALQNVNKYAKAERCMVIILKTGDKTTIKITDNGIGFNIKKHKKGIGLKNISERVKAIKGTLTINSNTNKGASIEIVF
jgi:signal transduction histidine kinase